MRNEISIFDAAGKTVEGFGVSATNNQAVITFTDGTFATIEANQDEYEKNLYISQSKLAIGEFEGTVLLDLRVFTKEELDQFAIDRKLAFEKECERIDRDTYERLKKKFEGE